jgi:hypothetical protein
MSASRLSISHLSSAGSESAFSERRLGGMSKDECEDDPKQNERVVSQIKTSRIAF